MKITTALTAIALLAATAATGRAAIVLSGDFTNGTTTPTVTITHDIVLEITRSGLFAFYLVLDEWTVSDGILKELEPASPQNFHYKLNGTPGTTLFRGLTDNAANTFTAISPNDGLLFFNSVSVAEQDVFTILAGVYTLQSKPNFNQALAGKTFTGDVFLTSNTGVRLSNTVTLVPEPSALLLSALGLLLLLRRIR
jgi:hypothetical protein